MSSVFKNPMQPLVFDECGTIRFRSNALVRYLLDNGGLDLNHLAGLPGISNDDRAQLAQLIGYSVSGFGDLPYTDQDVVAEADAVAGAMI